MKETIWLLFALCMGICIAVPVLVVWTVVKKPELKKYKDL